MSQLFTLHAPFQHHFEVPVLDVPVFDVPVLLQFFSEPVSASLQTCV